MNLKNRLIKKLKSEYSFSDAVANTKADDIIRKCQKTGLTTNLEEWVKGEERLSEIGIGKTDYTLGFIMAVCPGRSFYAALNIAERIVAGDIDLAEREIWTVRR